MKTFDIFDYSFSHVDYTSPFQISKYIKWDVNPDKIDELAIFTDLRLKEVEDFKVKIKIALILEPRSYKPEIYEYISSHYDKFDHILTYDKDLLKINSKFLFYPLGGCWIKPEDQHIYNKTKTISIICSWKRETIGHKLRHDIISNFKNNEIEVFGNGYIPIDNKITALKDFRYSIVVENGKIDTYFTEKIIDCFRTGVIPIYWGTDKITNFFNSDGIIQFDNIEDLNSIIDRLGEQDYEARKEAIVDNFNLADNYMLCEDWIYTNLSILK